MNEVQRSALLGIIQAYARMQHVASECLQNGLEASSYKEGGTNQKILEDALAGALVAGGVLYQAKLIEHGRIKEIVDAEAARLEQERLQKASTGGKPELRIVK